MAVKPQKRAAAAAPTEVPASHRPDIPAWLCRHARVLATALVLLATVRIVATYKVFNHTFDEPAHVACGIEWLADGVYKWEPQHPPLSRVAVSLLPYLTGARPQREPRVDIYAMSKEGTRILYDGKQYDRRLALARAGNLPFFWIACLVVFEWGRRYFGPAIGVAALAIFTFTPSILAHAGLATTDMALTAFLGASFLTGMLWLEQPTVKRALLFGAATALGLLSKFTILVYLPTAVVLALVWYYWSADPKPELAREIRRRLPTFALAVAISLPILWAGYRFSFGAPEGASFRMPAPEIYSGIQEVLKHNREGHPGYLLGEMRKDGFLMFYPVGLAVKTPIAILLLFLLGAALVARKDARMKYARPAAAFAAGILVPALTSHINIGIRHVLPIFIGVSLLAGAAAVWLLDPARTQRWARPAVGALAAWLAIASLLSHPDYLPYFNEFAGSHPENILVDSDLDWGQDTKRLAQRLRELGAREVTFGTLIIADLVGEHGFPPMSAQMDVMNPAPGWNAVSKTNWKEFRFGLGNNYPDYRLWPDRYEPTEKIGKGILLYYFDPAAMPR